MSAIDAEVPPRIFSGQKKAPLDLCRKTSGADLQRRRAEARPAELAPPAEQEDDEPIAGRHDQRL